MGCYNSCVVSASADEVWAVLRDFHDMSWASESVKSLERIGDAGDRLGAKRVINGKMHETLLAGSSSTQSTMVQRRCRRTT